MDKVLEKLVEQQELGVSAVVGTILTVEGSAYRREGARMLFLENGVQVGTLSAGCLETDVACRAEAVLAAGKPAMHTYDTSSEDDLTWGRGAGCNGVITVLVEPLSWSAGTLATMYWSHVLRCYKDGLAGLTLRCTDAHSGETVGFLIATEAGIIGTLGTPARDDYWRTRMTQFDGAAGRTVSFRDGNEVITLGRLTGRERVFIFGAGPDAEPMTEVLAQAGFAVTLVDHRPARLHPEYFSRAEAIIDCRPEQAALRLEIPTGSYAIVMTHSFQLDQVWVEFLLDKPLRYLGVLGPRLRTERLVGQNPLPQSVKSPIGLDIGADGPEEIAVSVAAELVQVRHASRSA